LGCLDIDGDGYGDTIDWASTDSSQWADSDSDSYGDNPNGTNGDDCPGEYGTSWQNGILGCIDSDGDGWDDNSDWNSQDATQWQDNDGDGWGDNSTGNEGDDCPDDWGNSTESEVLGCIDADGDGWADTIDSHPQEPTQWLDWDGDGYGDNVDGVDADDCPDQYGESTTDLLGCMDWDSDGMSNANDPDPTDPSLTIDPDDDRIDSSIDNCPEVSNAEQSDYDLDGIGDVCDSDKDGDTIDNIDDGCEMGEKDWTSLETIDVDGDGCRDLTEDSDDDGDGVQDGQDLCTNTADTYTGWNSTNGSGDPTNSTDWDGDGCQDDSGEDLDDDNDGIEDISDTCPYGPNGWKSTATTDEDSDGCEDITQDTDGDGLIDKFDQCPNTAVNKTVDDRGCSVVQNQNTFQNVDNIEEAEMSFGEKLVTGDLDAIGLILAIFLPVIGVTLTIMFQYRKRAHLRRLKNLILGAETKGQLHEAKALLKKSVSDERLTQAQYNLLLEEIDTHMENIDEKSAQVNKETREKGDEARSKSKEKWNKAVAEELQDESYSVDDEGVEWWEDEKKQWWYRRPDDDKWSKWED